MAPIFIGPRQTTGVLVSGSRNAIDMTARLPVTCTGSIVFARTVGQPVFDPQHLGDIGAVKIKIEEPDLFPVVGESVCKVHRNRGFPYAALPAQDKDNVFYIDLRFRWQPGRGAVGLCRGTRAAVLGTGLVFLFWCHGIKYPVLRE